jgi:hypothetical protein
MGKMDVASIHDPRAPQLKIATLRKERVKFIFASSSIYARADELLTEVS